MRCSITTASNATISNNVCLSNIFYVICIGTVQVSSLLLLNYVWLFVTPWTTGHEASLSITNSQSLPKLMSIELVIPSNHLILCCPLLLPPSIFPSIRVFSNESVLHIRWPEYWSFSFSISPSNKYSGLTSFRMDGLDLHAVRATLKSLLQHYSSEASILWHLAFFTFQLSHQLGQWLYINLLLLICTWAILFSQLLYVIFSGPNFKINFIRKRF